MDRKKLFKFLNRHEKYIVTLILLTLLVVSANSIINKSVTWDERCYIGLGNYYLKTGNYNIDGFIYHGSLSYYLNSIFLVPLNLETDAWDKDRCWDISNDIIFNSDQDPKKIVFLSRLPFIFISLLLGFYVFKWAKELYGGAAGLFSLTLYAFSPGIIANSRFAMTDFPSITFMFIALYYFWRSIKNDKNKYMIYAGIFVGLSLLSQFSGIFIFPIIFLLSLTKNKTLLIKRIIRIIQIGVIASLIIFIGYSFSLGTISSSLPDHYNTRVNEIIDDNFQGSLLKGVATFTYDKMIFPAPTYLAMVGDVIYSSVGGRKGYLLGQVTPNGEKPIYYFIVVFLVKSTLGFLILLLLSFIYFKNGKKSVIDELFLLVPAISTLIILSFNQFSFDLRHILLIYPLLFVFVGKLVNVKSKRQNLFYISIVLLLAFHVISSLSVYPNYVAYFNEIVSPDNGHEVLLGFNIDTGAELINLKIYMDENDIDSLYLSYHGGVNPKNYGIDFEYLPSTHFQYWVPEYLHFKKDFSDVQEDCSAKQGLIAISVSNLKGRYLNNVSCYSWLEDHEPIERIGYSIFIYNITDESSTINQE